MTTARLTHEPSLQGIRLAGITGTLVIAMAAGLFVHPVLSFGIAAVGIGLLVRPFDPFVALLATAAAASFVNNEGGRLTRDLSVVTLLGGYALLGLLLWTAAGRWRLPRAGLTAALLAFGATTALAAVRGVLAGHPLKGLVLELIPILFLGAAVAVGGLHLDRARLRGALGWLAALGLAHVTLGLISYSLHGVRTGGVWFTPIPGMLALLFFGFAMREPARGRRVLMLLLVAALLLHQVISLTRGYWMGLLVGFPVAALLYVRRGPGTGVRARRVAGSMTMFGGLLAAALLATSLVFGWGDVFEMLGTRFASSVGTERTSETASNIERLIEYMAAARAIGEEPALGQGLGYVLHIRLPYIRAVGRQTFVHEIYLLTWLKQGLVGLLAFLALLAVAIRTAIRGSRLDDPERAAWCAGTAAATVYLAAVGLTNYPFALVNATVLMAVLWGVALAVQSPPGLRLAWRERPRTGP